jgi:hypothetical protein
MARRSNIFVIIGAATLGALFINTFSNFSFPTGDVGCYNCSTPAE